MMTDYICGAKLQADNLDDAITTAIVSPDSLLTQDTIYCIESPGIGIGFLTWVLPITFMFFTFLGFGISCLYKNNK